MFDLHPQFITDTAGKKMVVLPKKEFDSLLEDLEELDDIRLYDKSKASKEPSIPIDEAFSLIEAKRKKKK